MFIFAFSVGVFSYLIFLLGILGMLYKQVVILLTVVYWGIFIWVNRKSIVRGISVRPFVFSEEGGKISKLLLLLVVLFFLQSVVNLIGVLGPELGFDALWYHLTFPKLYLSHHSVFYIPGGLLYYSAMPKLAELLYTGALAFGNEILVKLIHFSFGLFTCVVIYRLSRKFFSPLFSCIAVVIFYSNLVVDWESITAYIDLVRTFFEIMSLWLFINWSESGRRKWLVYSAIMVGLAITTKVLAIGSLVMFVVLLVMNGRWRIEKTTSYVSGATRDIIIYCAIALFVPLPWFIFSYIHTGNSVYPFFTKTYAVGGSISLFNPITFIHDTWAVLTHAPDPLSPVYLLFLPLIPVLFLRFQKSVKIILWYSLLGIIVWYLTPRTGGGRFILAYLPAFSIVCAACVQEFWKRYDRIFAYLLISVIIITSCISVGVRFIANEKYIPVILGQETKSKFLADHLNFHYGDFYDTDGYFAKTIKPTDRVLLYGFHNLYYVDFPFLDATWAKRGDTFNYVAVQNGNIPESFKKWKLVYTNKKTLVKLYRFD